MNNSDLVIIEHVITIYFNNKNSNRYHHTKKIFIYYQDLRKILIENYNIKLNFTIVGSNKEDSSELFNTYLKNDLFDDNYIEFDQNNITVGNKNFYNMLNDKWKKGILFAINNKISDILVMRGSNDIIDPNIYIQICKQFDKNVDKFYISSKSIHKLNIINLSILLKSDGNLMSYEKNTDFMKNITWDNQYPEKYSPMSRESISTISFIGLNINCWKKLLESPFDLYWNEIEMETYIRKNITNIITITVDSFFLNIKFGEDSEITNFNTIKTELIEKSDLNKISLEKMENFIFARIFDLIDYYNNNNDINYLIKNFDSIDNINNNYDKTKIFELCSFDNDNYLTINPNQSIEFFSDIRFTIP